MNKFEYILSKYRDRLVAPVVLLMSVLLLFDFYYILEITPEPNDECIWSPQEVSKDSIGFFFEDVKIDGVTWKAGIRDGDQLLEINNKVIKNLANATFILNSVSEGDSATYKVSRDGEVFETKVEVKKLIKVGGLAFALLAAIWLIVGFIVVKSKEQGIAQVTFFRIGLALVLFSSFNLLLATNVNNPLFKYPILVQVVDHLWTFGTVFLPFLILKFFWIFPAPIKMFNKKWLDTFLYLTPTILFVGLVIFKYYVVYPGLINSYKFYAIMGGGSVLAIFLAAFIGLISLFVNYFKIENKKDRQPIFVILLAFTVGISAAVYSFIIASTVSPAMRYNQPEFFLPIILVALLPVAFGYSIFKYSLMDVSDVIKTTILYGTATATIAGAYFLIIYALGQVLSSAIGTEYQGIIAGIIFVAFAIIFQSTKDRFQRLITKRFYPEQLVYQEVLIKFSNDILTIVGLDNILKSTSNTFIESLRLGVFGIVLKNNNTNKFELKEGVGIYKSDFNLKVNEESLLTFVVEKQIAKQKVVLEDTDFDNVCPEAAEFLISKGIYTVFPLVIKSKIIGLLLFGLKYSGSKFAGNDIELLSAAANQTAVAIENARLYESEKEKLIIDRDLETARDIQKGLLPRAIPQIGNLEISGTMIPAMQVGGDYFDVLKVSDSKVFIVVGDVSGKGLAASFYMSKLQTMIKLYSNASTTPYEILTKINSKIYSEMERNWFITCTIALLDVEKSIAKICRAGHTPISYIENGKAQNLIPKGLGIGLNEGNLFDNNLEELEIELKKDTILTFYSDGVNEAMNAEHETFNVDKLNNLLVAESNKNSEIIKSKLESAIINHRGNAPQNDDITFVIVKVK